MDFHNAFFYTMSKSEREGMHIGKKVYFQSGTELAIISFDEVRDNQYFLNRCEIKLTSNGEEIVPRRSLVSRQPKDSLLTLLSKWCSSEERGVILNLPYRLKQSQEITLTIWDRQVPYQLVSLTF